MKHVTTLLFLLLAATVASAQVAIVNDSLGIGTTMPQFQLDVAEIGSSTANPIEVQANFRVWGSLDVGSGTMFSFQPVLNINDNVSITGYVQLLPPGSQAGADSVLLAGYPDDLEETYVRLDVEEDAPLVGDCDVAGDTGRSRVGRDPAGLYICLDGAWLFVAATAAP